MTEIVSIRFNEFGKSYFFDPSGLEITKGEMVVVETAKGLEYGECVHGNHHVDDEAVVLPLRPVIRIATDADNKSAVKYPSDTSGPFFPAKAQGFFLRDIPVCALKVELDFKFLCANIQFMLGVGAFAYFAVF